MAQIVRDSLEELRVLGAEWEGALLCITDPADLEQG